MARYVMDLFRGRSGPLDSRPLVAQSDAEALIEASAIFSALADNALSASLSGQNPRQMLVRSDQAESICSNREGIFRGHLYVSQPDKGYSESANSYGGSVTDAGSPFSRSDQALGSLYSHVRF